MRGLPYCGLLRSAMEVSSSDGWGLFHADGVGSDHHPGAGGEGDEAIVAAPLRSGSAVGLEPRAPLGGTRATALARPRPCAALRRVRMGSRLAGDGS